MTEVAGGQKHIMECPLFLVFLADVGRNERMGIEEGTPLAGMPYLETFLVAAIDAALAAQNAVVAAESLGLSTVYIGALRNDTAAGSGDARPAAGHRRRLRPLRRLPQGGVGRRGEAAPAASHHPASRPLRRLGRAGGARRL